MKKWLKERFDRTPPQYGFLSEFHKTSLVLGVALGLVCVPINPFIACVILFAALFVPLYV